MTIYSHFLWNLALSARRPWRWRWAFAGGAVLPDIVYLPLMAGVVFEHGLGTWGDLARWDAAAAHPLTRALHSYLPVTAGLALAYALRLGALIPWLWGILTHVVLDMLTHVTDAYPIFWPLSDYRFPAPVSYWEPAYHGREFALVEHVALALVLLATAIRLVRRRLAGSHAACPAVDRSRSGEASAVMEEGGPS